jgi:hypothetical protein
MTSKQGKKSKPQANKPSPSPSLPPQATPDPNERQGTPFRAYFKWTAALTAALLQSLIQAKERALQTDGGFKAAAWNQALDDVLRAGGDGCTTRTLKNKYQDLRRIWKEWLLHLDVSGWG